MNEELVVEKGTIEDFLNLITNCYDDFISNNKFYKFYEYLSSIFMPFQQINQLVNSKKNVAHHYDCLLYTSPSPRDKRQSRMPSSA